MPFLPSTSETSGILAIPCGAVGLFDNSHTRGIKGRYSSLEAHRSLNTYLAQWWTVATALQWAWVCKEGQLLCLVALEALGSAGRPRGPLVIGTTEDGPYWLYCPHCPVVPIAANWPIGVVVVG